MTWPRRRFAGTRASTGMGDIDRRGFGLASKSHRDAGVGLRSSHIGWYEEEEVCVARERHKAHMSQTRPFHTNAISRATRLGFLVHGWRRRSQGEQRTEY